MKTKIQNLLLLALLFVTSISRAQGDYKNVLLSYLVPAGMPVLASDFETIPNNILITGIYPPQSNSIAGVVNPNNVSRIFLTDYTANNTAFNKAYLVTGVDVPVISSQFRYTVTEIKYDGTGYVICGNVSSSTFNDAFVMKVNTLGICQWFYRYKMQIPTSSTFFNSIEPVKAGSVSKSYVACGYRMDSLGIKRALVVRIDTFGLVMTVSKQLQEPLVLGKPPFSEYKKVINYNNTDFALTGYCNQLPDACGKYLQSDVLFSMYNLATDNITAKAIGTINFNPSNGYVDEGVSLVKIDTSSVVILSKYYDANGLACATQPDYQGNALWIKPLIPTNSGTWSILKSIKYNSSVGTGSKDIPKDILYEPSSGANDYIWLYGNQLLNKGYLLEISLISATNVITPKIMNNNIGLPQIDGKTIDFNTSNRVVGLTNLNTNLYSLFELGNTSNINCKSDSLVFPYKIDSVFFLDRFHDTLLSTQISFPHTAYKIPVNVASYCDSVYARIGRAILTEPTIYPNPTNGISTIEFQSDINSEIRITVQDISGRVIVNSRTNHVGVGINSYEIDLSKNKAGIYICTMEIEGKRTVVKVLKE